MKTSTRVIWLIVLAGLLGLLWLARFVIYPQLLLMSKADYSTQDAICIAEGRGRLVTVNGSPVGCTADPTRYTGSAY